jgi:hypothetical protein
VDRDAAALQRFDAIVFSLILTAGTP